MGVAFRCLFRGFVVEYNYSRTLVFIPWLQSQVINSRLVLKGGHLNVIVFSEIERIAAIMNRPNDDQPNAKPFNGE